MNKNLFLALVLAVLFVAGCSPQEPLDIIDPVTAPGERQGFSDWKTTALVDVQTGEEVRVADFAGEPLFVQPFAVRCANCLEQQQEIQALDVAHLAINTAPSEDEELVRSYFEQHGFSGSYVVSSTRYTGLLIDAFGEDVMNPSRNPVILVCPSGSSELLPRGFKSTQELEAFVVTRC